jgi:hypothetical protein
MDRGIADPHRPIAAIALEVRRNPFLDAVGRDHAVDRAQLVVRLRRDRQCERDEFFHRARRADAVERLHDEIGVAQPAIAVIPGTAGAGRFGNRRRVRRDDAAGLVEVGKLQRDRGTDDRFLPIVGDRQAAHPFHPVIVGTIDEFAAGRLQSRREKARPARTRDAAACSARRAPRCRSVTVARRW